MTSNHSEQLPQPPSLSRKESTSMGVLAFAIHQFIATWGIASSCPVVFILFLNLLRWMGRPVSIRNYYFILTENPYFPVQIAFGLLFGLLFGGCLRRRSMIWVWVLPFGILLYAFIATPVLIHGWASVFIRPTTLSSRLSHYFGWGCRPPNHCIDQLLITMPFYTSAAYSLGVLLARKISKYTRPGVQKQSIALMALGSLFFVATIFDLILSSRQGWHWLYLLFATLPILMGTLLVFVGLKIRDRSDVSFL